METHSNMFAWRIPWTEKPSGLQSLGSQRVGLDWETNTHPFTLKACLMLRTTSYNEFFNSLFSSISWRPFIFPPFWYHCSFLVTLLPTLCCILLGYYHMVWPNLPRLKKGMATHSNVLACKISWTEEPFGKVQGLQRVRHDWSMEHEHNIASMQLVVPRKTCK